MDRLDGPARLVLVSDLDGTMVDHQDQHNISLLRFNALWESEYRHNSLLIFSTGRSRSAYERLRKRKPLLTPDILITSVGTEITYGSMIDENWGRNLDHKWVRDIVVEETAKFPQLSSQSPSEKQPHKVSFFMEKDSTEEVIKSLSVNLAKRGLEVKTIYSVGLALDILPLGAGKGGALAYLLKKFISNGNIPHNILVCGDSGNDEDLFTVPEVYGVMVSNSAEELLEWHERNSKNNPKITLATERAAAGIIQSIGHFGLGPNISPRDIWDFSSSKLENFNPAYEVVVFYLLYERWLRAEVENSKQTIQGIRDMCYPGGIFVHPSGTQSYLKRCIDALALAYGDKQGKTFSVWIDGVSFSQIGSDAWLVKFDKWELSDEGQFCCLTTLLLNAKPETPQGFVLVHVHQTWLDGYAAPDGTTWIF